MESKNKKIQVLAREIKVHPKSIVKYLNSEGFNDISVNSVIPEDVAELVILNKEEFIETEKKDDSIIHFKPPFIVKKLAESLQIKPNVLIKDLIEMKIFASITQTIEQDIAQKIVEKHGKKLVVDKREKNLRKEQELIQPENIVHEENKSDRIPRPPVVVVMGHVDHGKTTLLDSLRNSKVVEKEAGRITQHTGASQIVYKNQKVTFLDTPGHASFSAMRQRGTKVTDLALLVVAADDGINLQTKEALKQIQDAKLPYIVVINKMDLPNADSNRVLTELQKLGILTEEWGGDIGVVKISALKKEGFDELIERIVLEAEIQELTTNPKLPGKATVIESQIETGVGATASVIVNDGSFKVGDVVICGEFYGKIRAMIDSDNNRIKKSSAGDTLKILGLSGAPDIGYILVKVNDEKEAKSLARDRAEENRQKSLSNVKPASVEQLFAQVEDKAKKKLPIIIKADVKGTAEAISHELSVIPNDEVELNILTLNIGPITESDIQFAENAGALIIGFHVRTNPGVNKIAKQKNIDIKLYSVIYELVDDIREKLTGMLDSNYEENIIGHADILKTFMIRNKKICGCRATKGVVKVGAHARVFRDKEIIYNGSIKTLKHFKDEVKEIKQGLECGILLDNFDDFEENDMIQVYEYKEIKKTL